MLFLCNRGRHLPDGSCRRLYVLLLDRRRHIRHGKSQLRQTIRVQPDAHGVIRSVDIDVTHPGNALNLIDKIDTGVIFEKFTAVYAVRRIERADKRHIIRCLLRRNAIGLHLVRQTGLGDRHVILHLNRVHVAVRPQLELNGQRIAPAVVRIRRHVIHALRAVDLLLDDLCYRFIDDAGIRSDIIRRDIYRRRGDLRILRNRQIKC